LIIIADKFVFEKHVKKLDAKPRRDILPPSQTDNLFSTVMQLVGLFHAKTLSTQRRKGASEAFDLPLRLCLLCAFA
jgi:hypothetical protein